MWVGNQDTECFVRHGKLSNSNAPGRNRLKNIKGRQARGSF
ncbi:hypothetical protein AK973_4328 [Pseudomonas brassicacearum]|nr:hypothetical protein AK973_4328 [Pseudomonas brassicacearum]